MTLHIPVEVHSSQYSLVSHGFQTTEFECDHLFYHKELIEGEMFNGEGLSSYKAYAYVCDNCEESIENVMEDGCNE